MSRQLGRAALTLLVIAAFTARAEAQHMPGMHHAAGSGAAPLGLPFSRMGSGTAWLPDAAGMRAWHFESGAWQLMLHGEATTVADQQFGSRGDGDLFNTNWIMLMAMRPLAGGLLHLHGMASAEPWTVGGAGYPLLLQTGESYRGAPLHDRQHPHDLFMELSAIYERPIGRDLALLVYAAPVGEPALGPVAFMHRPSARNDPLAPIGHHWEDATHITYGVLTGGLYTRRVRLEASLFNGREPDADRTDFDFGRMDSWSGRLSYNPSPEWGLAAWVGRLVGPEAAHPDESVTRFGAAVQHIRPRPGGEWASTVLLAANRHADGSTSAAFLAESSLDLDRRTALFGRAEWVGKTAEELVIAGVDGERRFGVGQLTAGAVRTLVQTGPLAWDLGVRGSVALVPASLEEAYGRRTPAGLAGYLRVRPATMRMARD